MCHCNKYLSLSLPHRLRQRSNKWNRCVWWLKSVMDWTKLRLCSSTTMWRFTVSLSLSSTSSSLMWVTGCHWDIVGSKFVEITLEVSGVHNVHYFRYKICMEDHNMIDNKPTSYTQNKACKNSQLFLSLSPSLFPSHVAGGGGGSDSSPRHIGWNLPICPCHTNCPSWWLFILD